MSASQEGNVVARPRSRRTEATEQGESDWTVRTATTTAAADRRSPVAGTARRG